MRVAGLDRDPLLSDRHRRRQDGVRARFEDASPGARIEVGVESARTADDRLRRMGVDQCRTGVHASQGLLDDLVLGNRHARVRRFGRLAVQRGFDDQRLERHRPNHRAQRRDAASPRRSSSAGGGDERQIALESLRTRDAVRGVGIAPLVRDDAVGADEHEAIIGVR